MRLERISFGAGEGDEKCVKEMISTLEVGQDCICSRAGVTRSDGIRSRALSNRALVHLLARASPRCDIELHEGCQE